MQSDSQSASEVENTAVRAAFRQAPLTLAPQKQATAGRLQGVESWHEIPGVGKAVPLQGGERREVRKIAEMGRSTAEVEENRLPGSARKTLLRITNELESHLDDEDGRKALHLAVQLANRLFEIIRRDLRPW